MAKLPLQLLLALTASQLAIADDVSKPGELLRGGGIVQEAQPLRPEQAEKAPHNEDFDFAFSGGIDEARPIEKPKPAPLPAKELKPRRLEARSSTDKKSAAKASLTKSTDSLITVGGSLCVVLTLFFGLAWITRRGQPKTLGKLPGEVIEVLGKAPLIKGQDLQLVRVGAKLLLLCVTPTGCETLTEITNPDEVDRLAAICRSSGPSSMTAAFNRGIL